MDAEDIFPVASRSERYIRVCILIFLIVCNIFLNLYLINPIKLII
jgi:hypothetical protein